MTILKPMLAIPLEDEASARFDSLGGMACSPKIDGFRMLVTEEGIMSRAGNVTFGNPAIEELFSLNDFIGCDGELVYGDPADPDCFNNTTSALKDHNGPSSGFTFYIFDDFSEPELPYAERIYSLQDAGVPNNAVILEQTNVDNYADLVELRDSMLRDGYEGMMARGWCDSYKYGRVTPKEDRRFFKLKIFATGEAVVIGMEEAMANYNEAEADAFGYMKRSTRQEGKVGKGTMGALVVKDLLTEVTFKIGSGFTDSQREWFWSYRSKPSEVGVVTYKHMPHGAQAKPRHPIYVGLRMPEDMDKVMLEQAIALSGVPVNERRKVKNKFKPQAGTSADWEDYDFFKGVKR